MSGTGKGMSAEMVRACRVEELADGSSMRLGCEPPIAVHRCGDEFFATADTCSHEKWSLGEEGELDGYEVTCTLHMARFDVRDGRPLCLPATLGLRSYPVQVVDGVVLVGLTAVEVADHG
jgi:nitrite reductase/ring-hydroxylating ferredoxin subunit